MKYIRTKEGKILKGNPNRVDTDRFEIIKVADTIEELCDEFVIADVEHKSWERVFKPALELVLKDYDKPYEVYGAIWTDKGLIYVAKLNEKGCLELL